jgi:hypothetical protein
MPKRAFEKNEGEFEKGLALDAYLSISVSTYLTNPSFWILSAI